MVSHYSQNKQHILILPQAIHLNSSHPPGISHCFGDKDKMLTWGCKPCREGGTPPSHSAALNSSPLISLHSQLTGLLYALEHFHTTLPLCTWLPPTRGSGLSSGLLLPNSLTLRLMPAYVTPFLRIRGSHPPWADAIMHLGSGLPKQSPGCNFIWSASVQRTKHTCMGPPWRSLLCSHGPVLTYLPSECHASSFLSTRVSIRLMPASFPTC